MPAQSTIDPAASYAWGGDTGWIDFRPSASEGLVLTERTLSGDAYAANFGWIHFGDGTPANGISYSNTSSTDFGVNHDGFGRLTGLAYSGNIGWVVFEQTSGKPAIDLSTGAFEGHAWAPNIGWITLTTVSAASIAIPDTDLDGIADHYEIEHFGNLTAANASTNADGDAHSDLEEYQANTDPNDPDSLLAVFIDAVQPAGGGKDVDYTLFAGSGRLLTLEFHHDLSALSAGGTRSYPILESPGAVADSVFIPDTGPQTSDRHFFRLKAEIPLQP